MVKVREDYPLDEQGEVDINAWVETLLQFGDLGTDARTKLRNAAGWSQELQRKAVDNENRWSEHSDAFITGLEMAQILAELRLDLESIEAALLYRHVREETTTLEAVKKRSGKEVAKLIDGVLRMAAISQARTEREDKSLGKAGVEQIEAIRKMLVAVVDDVRVALIKIAERTCAIRAVKEAPEAKRIKVAREVFDVYAPLAHRLGIGHIKWELEDLSFRYLEPDSYKQIAKLLDGKRLDRQQYIDNTIAKLHKELGDQNIDAEIAGRAKHIYSIWRKMRRKNIGFSQVYDIRAVRILVDTVQECYAVLGVIHTLWRNIPNEFDDYINAPKENGYRSLHTAVIGDEGKVLEVQIRTRTMHEEAEYGVCAHWLYKGTDVNNKANSYEEKIEWLRQVLEWHEETGGDEALDDQIGGSVTQDRIYVFTPDGHVIDLPLGATPLDFAYRVHTEVGHRCRGAKVNGRIVPLNHVLTTSDQVEIITGKVDGPSRDWLTPALGYLQTNRARSKVAHWFKQQARDQNITDGRVILDKEFKRLGLMDIDFDKLSQDLNLVGLEDLYAAVGASDLGVNQVLNAAQSQVETPQVETAFKVSKPRSRPDHSTSDVEIMGIGNMLSTMASCCGPVPGDEIVGFITKGRGVSVHRSDCTNVLQLQQDEPERIIKVDWGSGNEQTYPVELIIEAYDRVGLLSDITKLLDSERINVISMYTKSDKTNSTVTMTLTAEVSSLNKLSRLLALVNQLPNVMVARRT